MTMKILDLEGSDVFRAERPSYSTFSIFADITIRPTVS